MDQINSVMDSLRFTSLDALPGLTFIQTKYGVRPSLVLLGLLGVMLALSPFFNTYSLLASIICYLIPAYLSFLALETPEPEDDIRFLTYWIIFSFVEVGQPFLRLFLSKFIYTMFRILLTIALLHPFSDLSLKIYNKLIGPFLKKHEAGIDTEITELAEQGKKKLVDAIKENL
jgi:receptor expression-enhancing protein 5/6